MPQPATIALSALAAFLFTAPASAEWLDNDSAVRALVSGKRIYLKVPLGGEFPLHYKSNGRVTGDGSALGLGKFFAPAETGKWWIDEGRLCQRFPTWYKAKTTCFLLRPTGETRLRWKRDDGYSGRARIEP